MTTTTTTTTKTISGELLLADRPERGYAVGPWRNTHHVAKRDAERLSRETDRTLTIVRREDGRYRVYAIAPKG